MTTDTMHGCVTTAKVDVTWEHSYSCGGTCDYCGHSTDGQDVYEGSIFWTNGVAADDGIPLGKVTVHKSDDDIHECLIGWAIDHDAHP